MNSRRYTMTSLSIVFLALTIMSVSAIGQNAYAAGGGMSLSADCSGSSCDISGTTDRNDQDVTVVITASNGNIVQVDQLSVSGGSFSTTFNVSGSDDGTYKIAANQGASSKYSLNVSVDVSGGSSDSSASVSNQIAAAAAEEETAAAASGLTLSAGGVEGSTTIDVSGTTDRSDEIIIKVTAPNGNLVSVDQITPSGGSYSSNNGVDGMSGDYTITAKQSDGIYTMSVTITESDSSASTTSLATTSETAVAETTSAPAGGLTITASDSVRGSTTIDVSGTTDRD